MEDSPYFDPAAIAVYERVTAPFQFAPPAGDLVAMLRLASDAVVLDVGTGTGVVARAARSALGPTGLIVGVDGSIDMLRCARRATARLAVAQVPTLPFRDCTFDAVMAGFVVAHFESYEGGLTEMARVCRTNGRLGVSVWGSAPNAAAAIWSDTAGQYAARERLNAAFHDHIPWDEWFSERGNVSRALETAGLASVAIDTRHYTVRMPTPDYLRSRETSMQGMVLRRAVTDRQWDEFRERAAAVFRSEFGETVEYVRDVHFGVGTKPFNPGG